MPWGWLSWNWHPGLTGVHIANENCDDDEVAGSGNDSSNNNLRMAAVTTPVVMVAKHLLVGTVLSPLHMLPFYPHNNPMKKVLV